MTLTLRSLSQRITIFSAKIKNTNILNMVEKYNFTRVPFTEYAGVDDLSQKLRQLAAAEPDSLCIII